MTNKLDKIPFLRLLIPFIAGIVIQERLRIDEGSILIIFLVLLISLAFIIVFKMSDSYRWNIIFGIILNCVFCLSGMKLPVHTMPLPGTENLRSGCVTYIPEEKQATYKVVLGMLREKRPEGWRSLDGKALLYMKKTDAVKMLEPGDLLVFYGSLLIIDSPSNPMEFDFRRYCINHDIYWKTYLDENDWKKLTGKRLILILPAAELIRLKLVRFIQSQKMENESLINTILLGYRDGLTGEQQKYFAASGAMHILAVSGMHVAIIYGALVFIAGIFIKRKSGWPLLFPLPVIWLYAFLTGMTPSVTRSAIMISLYVVSRFLNRKTEGLNIILASAFFMIMIKPSFIHQVSFQLSFAAIAGITIVFQGLYRRLKTGIWLMDQAISLCCLSFAAQLFIFPLSIYYFHRFPNYFLVTNLFAVPLTGLILITGFVFFLSFFIPTVSSFLGVLLDRFTGVLYSLTRITGTLPFSSTENISINTFEVIVTYLIILLLIRYINTRRILNLYLFLAGIAIICGENCQKIICQSNKKEIVVLSIQGSIAINFISGMNNLVITDDTITESRSRITSRLLNYWCSLNLDEPDFLLLKNHCINDSWEKEIVITGSNDTGIHYIQFCNTKIGILDDKFRKPTRSESPLSIDLLVINLRYPVQVSELKDCFNPGVIIIHRDVPAWLMRRIEEECIEYDFPCHNISRSGYFKLEL
jgi:competence protein ComEC